MTIQAIPYHPSTLCLRPDATLLEALRLMLDKQVNHVPLCDSDGRFAGIVSTHAILLELIPISARVEQGLSNLKFAGDAAHLLSGRLQDLERRTVAEVAKNNLPVLEEDCPVLEAALLLSQSATPLPVVSRDGKLRGLLSRRALLSHLMQQAGL